jgi:ribonucleoside-diphosphate reductase alpha chain
LISKALPYDSEEGRHLARQLQALIHFTAYNTSAQLAEELGPFEGFEENKEHMLEVIKMHTDAYTPTSYDDLTTLVMEEREKLLTADKFRNAQVTVIAPTGTIGIQMDCDTTGIEPMTLLKSYKKLAGGGEMVLTPKCVESALLNNKNLSQVQVVDIIKHIEDNNTIEGAPHIDGTEFQRVFHTAFGKGTVIDSSAHLKMMAAVQPFVSGAISKTVNLPKEATIDDIKDIYMQSWKMGLKAVALYRDGSKGSQPLNEKSETEKEVVNNTSSHKPLRRRLDKTRKAEIHKFTVGGHEGYIITGFYEDGTLGEIFIEMSKQGQTLRGLLDLLSINMSMLLQVGYPIDNMIEKMKGTSFAPNGFTDDSNIKIVSSIADYIGRYLEQRYLNKQEPAVQSLTEVIAKSKEITFEGPICPCGGMSVPNGACYICTECGTSTGCS